MIDTASYKVTLEKEREKLEEELNRLGAKDATTQGNWDVKQADLDIMDADQNESADRIEEMHINAIVLTELETRYRDVVHALEKIGAGTYGICEISGVPIEEDRLVANPAARTCKMHMEQGDQLAQ